MTDENRAELRRGIEAVVRASMVTGCYVSGQPRRETYTGKICADVAVYRNPSQELPPLTTAQQLALSVLLGDEAVLPQALADYLLDQGHEYATAVAEKARVEERERIAKHIEERGTSEVATGWLSRSVAADIRSTT